MIESLQFDINKFDNFPSVDLGTYIYLRVSTEKQSTDGQLKEVHEYCERNRLYPPANNIFIDHGVSGKINWKERKLFDIVQKLEKKNVLIVPELSRLGRNMTEIQSLIHILVIEKKVMIHDIKNNLKLDGSFQSSVMAMLFSMCAEMERTLISERVKKGMSRDQVKENLKKRQPRFRNKLDGKEDEITDLLKRNTPKTEISKALNVHNAQLHKFIKDKNIAV